MHTYRFWSLAGSCLVTFVLGVGSAQAQNPSDAPNADPKKRIWVRGCPVDSDCRRQLRTGLREFEVKLGRKSSRGSPWLKVAAKTTAIKPSSVDPKLAWLDKIKKPDLPIRWNRALIEYLNYYKNDRRGRAIMSNWLIDQGKYEALIVSTLRKAKLPQDLLYICMIESSYNPHEYSRAGASGLWQFMPSGARIYGMRRSRWLDERNDPIKSTKAVMMYFADLHHRFRNWHLAMAAYNQGYNGMLRSLAKYNTNDYWQLLRYENALPRDTALYVPKALAAAIIGRNRALFGFDKLKLKKPVAWDQVMVPRSTTLATLAKAAGVTVKQIRLLNPQLLRGRTPPGIRNYTVRIPRGSGARFSRRYDSYRAEWNRYDEYTLSHGELLKNIAAMHGIAMRSLKRINGIKHSSTVGGGDVLLVPRLTAKMKRLNLARAKRRRLRRTRRSTAEPRLVAVPDKNLQIAGKRRVFYRVIKGDSLIGVARAFRVTPAQLAAWNKIRVNGHLYPRMYLQVFVEPSFSLSRARIKALDPDQVLIVTRGSAEHLHMAELRNGRQRLIYRAKRRESFARIGKKFGLTARDLARINRRSSRTVLRPGDEIIVYQVIDASRSRRSARQALRLRKHRQRVSRKNRANERRRKPKADGRNAERRKAERTKAERTKAERTKAERTTVERTKAERRRRRVRPKRRRARTKRRRARTRRRPASIRRR